MASAMASVVTQMWQAKALSTGSPHFTNLEHGVGHTMYEYGIGHPIGPQCRTLEVFGCRRFFSVTRGPSHLY